MEKFAIYYYFTANGERCGILTNQHAKYLFLQSKRVPIHIIAVAFCLLIRVKKVIIILIVFPLVRCVVLPVQAERLRAHRTALRLRSTKS